MAEPTGATRFALPSDRVEHGIPVRIGLIVLAAAAALLGALAGAEPVGVTALDVGWSAAFSAVIVLAASRSRRLPATVMAGVAGVVGIGGGPVGLAFGVLSLLSAFFIAFSRNRDRLVGGLVGLVASQALLRGPSFGFTGLPTLVAGAAVIPVVVSAWRIARTRERRTARWVLIGLGAVVLVGAATAGAAAYEARRQLQSAADLADTGLDQLRTGDTEAAADTFSKAQFQFERASSQLNGPLGLVGRALPVVAPNLTAMRRVSASGEDLGFTASQAAATADWRGLTASGGQVDLATVRSMQEPLAKSSQALDAALATVADVRSPWLLPPLDHQLDRFDDKIRSAADEASIATDGLQVAPALLGGDGPRRYLVVFATPGESRNAGGFAGAFAVVDAVDGKLTVSRTGSTMTDLPEGRDPYQLDLPEGWNDLYSSYEVGRFPGNMTASPDWPTDADVAAQIYEQAPGGAPIDGVVYADPAAMAALLAVTGPVVVAGVPEPLTTENAEQYLLLDQYVQYQGRPANTERKEVLGDVAKAVFDALTERPLPGIRTLTDALGPAVAGGHLRITAVPGSGAVGAPDAQAFLDRVGLSGRFAPHPDADYLSLRSSNLLPSKLDAFLSRDVTATVTVDPVTGDIRTVIEARLTNDAPSSGLPDYVLGTGTIVPRGTNRDLLSLYTPLNLLEVTVDGAAVGVQSRKELGGNVFAVPVEIPAGEHRTVRYVLYGPPPAGLVATGDYTLEVLPQPLARPDTWAVEVLVGDEQGASVSETLASRLEVVVPVTDMS